VTGPTPESVASAVAQINELMRVDASPGMGEVTEAVPCPPGIVGRIIGRGGETIRGLQQASQAHIVVNQVREASCCMASRFLWLVRQTSQAVHDTTVVGTFCSAGAADVLAYCARCVHVKLHEKQG